MAGPRRLADLVSSPPSLALWLRTCLQCYVNVLLHGSRYSLWFCNLLTFLKNTTLWAPSAFQRKKTLFFSRAGTNSSCSLLMSVFQGFQSPASVTGCNVQVPGSLPWSTGEVRGRFGCSGEVLHEKGERSTPAVLVGSLWRVHRSFLSPLISVSGRQMQCPWRPSSNTGRGKLWPVKIYWRYIATSSSSPWSRSADRCYEDTHIGFLLVYLN